MKLSHQGMVYLARGVYGAAHFEPRFAYLSGLMYLRG